MSTPRPDSAPAPGAATDRTVRLVPGPETIDGTVRLGPGAEAEPEAAAESEVTVRLDGTEAASATFLDPRAWGGAPEPGETTTLVEPPPDGGSPAERPFAPGELRRFGPGVPPRAAAVWHGAAGPQAHQPPRPRRVRLLLLAVVLLLAVPAFLFWRFATPALAVAGVAVRTDPAGPGCGGTAVITAELETNGGAGTVRYRWLRSDGTTSGEMAREIGSGAHRADLVLRWSFEGQGSLRSTATLEILAPAPRSAAVTFAYHCP
ncbi:hypothetical protein [Kitasatospora sp. NPDC091207]|uniref:hypothetical protein n=1 Tax=Kitasatospora sp. NPDC091207 TaxID=3364083 RepID=UPI0038293B4A